MRVVMFYHSLVSDWNHGNAHFLRGVVSELIARGHDVSVCEPENAWSAANLRKEGGNDALVAYREAYPHLTSTTYSLDSLDVDATLEGADLVLVHEWNDHSLVARLGEHRSQGAEYRLFFHDTHHRCITDPAAMAAYDLRNYDGVLVFGEIIRDVYLRNGWAERVWTWHEAADVRVFYHRDAAREGDLVWIGNWGDEERTAELREYLIDPVRDLNLRAEIFGVRYPASALETLRSAGITYRGWIANHRVPETFARFRATVHVPRRPYAESLRGIPTIRVFEALACGIPLVSAPWEDSEGLFAPGKDYLFARDGNEMRRHLRLVLSDHALAAELAAHGLRTIRSRHTCAHRVDQLMTIAAEVSPATVA